MSKTTGVSRTVVFIPVYSQAFGMEFDGLADGWQVWSAEPTKAVVTFRPDVFDTQAYPAACLPTIYVTKGRRGRRPGRDVPAPDASWYVTLYLEPDVSHDELVYETQEAAETGAVALSTQFVRGEIDYRELYQVPRPEYFEKLDELTGQNSS